MRMFRIILCSFLMNVYLLLNVQAYDWSTTLARVEESIVRVNADFIDDDGDEAMKTCTGFIINQRENYVLTAHHCLGEQVRVDGMMSYIVKDSDRLDLTILVNLASPGRPALKPSSKQLRRGLPVAALGYGHAQASLTSKTGAIMAPAFTWHGFPGVYFLVDFGLVSGMSGGPMVDAEGRVVSINQQTDPDTMTGLGRPLSVLREFAKGYWR